MTKLEQVIAELKKLPPEMQEDWAAMFLDQLDEQHRYTLTDEQVEEVRRRMADKNPVYLTLEEAKERLAKLLG
ncbi:MAG: hypothetical protein JSR81_09080 [Proteobacteria bacterium]|nr:hypothetical protein [Pseudomonadota bacterium]